MQMTHSDLTADLTEPQREAVMHTHGPLLVLAGAGSGKTRVITRRAAYLARTVARPHEILAITFTNKAAGEMRERILRLGVGRGMTVTTFHSFCARLLREFAGRLGLKTSYSIFDDDDRMGVLRDAIEACDLSTDNYSPRMVQNRISRAKNDMQSVEEFGEKQRDFTAREVVRIWGKYEELMRAQNAVDFDDLLILMARLLGEHEDVRELLSDRFPYLLIDEYQDTNHPQYLIATLLAKKHRNICATGDPDQSIYGWRGADIHNILSFEEDYPDARVVRLEQNYRSTPSILSAASALISHNVGRKKKSLWTENSAGEAVRVWRCSDEHDEADRIADDIARYVLDRGKPSEVAIFYRVSALTRVLEDSLRRARVPYQIARGVEFYSRKEIKDVLAYLRLIVNPDDDIAVKRAINTPPRGIGKTTLDRLMAYGRERHCSLDAAITAAGTIESVKSASKKLASFAVLIATLRRMPRRPVQPLVEKVVRASGLQKLLDDDPDPEKPALANVNEFITAAAEYDREHAGEAAAEQARGQATELDGTLEGFLEQIALVSDTDRLNLAGGAVTLMTLHAAKGLEFPLVYIVGLEQELLPHRRALLGGDSDMEEERRLCFVGMTRAMKRLTLTYANYRTLRGLSQRTLASKFLRELPTDELNVSGDERPRDDGYDVENEYSYDEFDPEQWYIGRRVRHPFYGEGAILRLEPRGRTAWVRIDFDQVGEKSFLIDHAPLTFVG